MGKKRSRNGVQTIPASKAYPILEVDYSASDPLFTASFHPATKLFATGSSQGQVVVFKYDPEKLENARIPSDVPSDLPDCTSIGVYGDEIDLADVESDDFEISWKTKRHNGSCRDVIFDSTGDFLYSAGKDGVIKKADTKTGKVVAKVKRDPDEEGDITKILTVPDKPFLVVGDEDGDIKCYDTNSMKQIYEIEKVHDDTVNSINHCAPKSDYKFVSVGSMTVSNWDIRKEKVITQSEPQDDELLTSGWLDQESQDTLLCGMSGGVVTLWKPELNKLSDQISRINLSKEESVESIISAMDGSAKYAYAGLSDGTAIKIDVNTGNRTEERKHSDDGEDDVAGLDLDYEYRLVTYGTGKLKIWTNKYDDESSNSETDDNPFIDSDEEKPKKQKKSDKHVKSKVSKAASDGIMKFDDL